MASSSQTDNDRILRLVGAIVLTGQDVERYLKAILPFTNAEDPSLGAALKRQDKLARRPLGELAGKLLEASTSDSVGFAEHLAKLVDSRNQVVHHFNEAYGAKFAAGQTREVTSSLESVLFNLEAFRASLEHVALVLFEALRDVVYQGTPEYRQMAALCASFRARVVS
jgi:hypothetical protein